jgi:hypothetical protein
MPNDTSPPLKISPDPYITRSLTNIKISLGPTRSSYTLIFIHFIFYHFISKYYFLFISYIFCNRRLAIKSEFFLFLNIFYSTLFSIKLIELNCFYSLLILPYLYVLVYLRRFKIEGRVNGFEEAKRTMEKLIEQGRYETRYFCYTCWIEKEENTKHCSICKICVDKHDHHCPSLGNCVNEKSSRVFYFYIIYTFLLLFVLLFFCDIEGYLIYHLRAILLLVICTLVTRLCHTSSSGEKQRQEKIII